jgi:imidazolonepropionase-like amidohydrolase
MPARLSPPAVALAVAALVILAGTPAAAQQSTAPAFGIRDVTPRHHALVNARIVTAPGRVIERGTVVVRDGRIEAVTPGESVPAGATRHDLGGKTVMAGFIDLAANVGVPAAFRPAPPPAFGRFGGGAQPPAPRAEAPDAQGPRYWNRRVRPERDVASALDVKADDAKALREQGFAAALAVPEAGIFRGQSALLALRGDGASDANDLMLGARVFQHVGVEYGSPMNQDYPASFMGVQALIRQALLDARWHRDVAAEHARGRAERPEANLSLEALAPVLDGRQRVMFDARTELEHGRWLAIAREFGLGAVLLGNGTDYRVLPKLAAAKVPVVVPLGFPEPPAVEEPETAVGVALADLEHWEQAPANAARLVAAGVPIALTARGLKDPKSFLGNLRRAVAAGLAEDAALAALTEQPARILGMEDRLGRIAPGYAANLVVADGELFRADGASIYQVWIDGVLHEVKPLPRADLRGGWQLAWSDGRGPTTVDVAGTAEAPELTAGERKATGRLAGGRVLFTLDGGWFGLPDAEKQRVSLVVDGDRLDGVRALPDGGTVAVSGTRTKPGPAPEALKPVERRVPPPFRGYPAGEYGREAPPVAPDAVLVRNATIWTMGPDGILENADLLVRRGKVAAVGRNLAAPANAVVIDATGRHVAPGIIDAHSHSALIGNVNEGTHAVTTEVRTADILDPTDISLYRQLAGGVTAANLLHGSANPMGGQATTIKLRWGRDAEGLLMEGAPGGIKFALGENVKQSNWGEMFTSRYPQTRMGVEQIMLDTFTAAKAYGEAWDAWNRSRRGPAPRRDLRLEAVLEILRGQRLVHIHSYRADEILMFVRLAERFGFQVAAFQHVLEGYKVAPELAAAGAGASSFTDWWSFKWEAYDAIPHNPALLTRAGVLTSINSDSDELARRLNSDAAKAVKYGGLSEVEALALVTINPARQLGVGDRIGSLEPGKDADFVIWSDNPLSTFAVVEQTFIDGAKYYDRAEDRAARDRVARERERLVQAILPERSKAIARGPGGPPNRAADPRPPVGYGNFWTWRIEADRHRLADLAVMYANRRGLYHDGQDIVSCSASEHLH